MALLSQYENVACKAELDLDVIYTLSRFQNQYVGMINGGACTVAIYIRTSQGGQKYPDQLSGLIIKCPADSVCFQGIRSFITKYLMRMING